MRAARILACLSFLAAGTGLASAPPRYLPAPSGKFYYLLYGQADAFGVYTSSETDGHVPAIDTARHPFESSWNASANEIGMTAGYGLGKVWFLPGVDLSVYVPFYFRSYELTKYLETDQTKDNPATPQINEDAQATYARTTLHQSLSNPGSGKGLGDVQLSLLSLLLASSESGAWLSSALKVSLPTSDSAAERFTRILHGEVVGPGAGAGTARLTPALSAIKTIAGQRAFLSVEYAIPLGQESFAFNSPDLTVDGITHYWDAAQTFHETFKYGGMLLGTLGLDTTMAVAGVSPGLEINFRQMSAATWTEAMGAASPADGTNQPTPISWLPNHNPEFLRAAAWAVGGIPLKSVTQTEIGLTFSRRFGTADLLKAGVSYIASTWGNSYGFKIAFISLFLEHPPSDRAVPGKPEAREVDVAPMLEAPAAPASRILTAVTFPLFGAGLSQEEASWAAGQLRKGVRGLNGYDLLSESSMEQLALEPCGDAACGARFGKALKVPAVVVSRLQKTSGGFTLGVQMIDVAAGTSAASQSASAASLDELKNQIPGLLEKLVHPPAAAPAAAPARR